MFYITYVNHKYLNDFHYSLKLLKHLHSEALIDNFIREQNCKTCITSIIRKICIRYFLLLIEDYDVVMDMQVNNNTI